MELVEVSERSTKNSKKKDDEKGRKGRESNNKARVHFDFLKGRVIRDEEEKKEGRRERTESSCLFNISERGLES